jgi:type II secretory pathway component PulM
MESIYRDVAALDETHRRSLEALLGHELQANQHVYIAVVSEPPKPNSEQREQILQRLRAIGAEVDAHLQKQGIADDEWEAAVDAASEEVRYGKQT